MIGIYKFTNKITSESYIGQSTNLQKRYNQHKTRHDANNGNVAKENTYFHFMLRYYGFHNFDYEVVEECAKSELNDKEIFYIKKFNTLYPNGYNLTKGGNLPHVNRLKNTNVVREIQVLLKTSILSNIDIGKIYGVSDQAISDINSGRAWFDDKLNYPIRNGRKIHNNTPYCNNCGKLISYKTKTGLCRGCYLKHKKNCIPDKDTLFSLLLNHSFVFVASKYGVSDNAVRKWCDNYGLPRHSKYYRLAFNN